MSDLACALESFYSLALNAKYTAVPQDYNYLLGFASLRFHLFLLK